MEYIPLIVHYFGVSIPSAQQSEVHGCPRDLLQEQLEDYATLGKVLITSLAEFDVHEGLGVLRVEFREFGFYSGDRGLFFVVETLGEEGLGCFGLLFVRFLL